MQKRIDTAQQAIASVQDSGEGETKSSAGDKFETSREMMKQEIERTQQLLVDATQIKHALDSLDPHSPPNTVVGVGSLVHTNQGVFYLAVGVGKISVEGQDVFVLSPAAPVGKLLMGKSVGEQVTFNGRAYMIKALE
jgi:transcription elongation GreA/GreB family factor